jgi:hypothetical protein
MTVAERIMHLEIRRAARARHKGFARNVAAIDQELTKLRKRNGAETFSA